MRPLRYLWRTPLLLLHQSPLTGRMFDRVLPFLATDRLVVMPDRIGHGTYLDPLSKEFLIKNNIPIELTVRNGEYTSTRKVDYHGGERYPHLERRNSRAGLGYAGGADWLG